MTTSADPGSKPTAGRPHPVERAPMGMSEQQARELDRRVAREHSEAPLDEALGETFPANDPVAIIPRTHHPR